MSPARRAWLLVPLAALVGACAPEPPTAVKGEAEAPGVPRDLAASPEDSERIDLEWQPPAADTPRVASYRVYRDGEAVAESEGTSYTDADLDSHTTYAYRVSALAAGGAEGERSDSVVARTLDGSPPGEPSDLRAETAGSSSVELAWEAASDSESGVSGYHIYRDGERIARTSETSFGDTGLEASTTYRYEVSAVNGAGLESDRAGPVSATTDEEVDDTPPGAPPELEGTATGPNEAKLEWKEATDPESGIAHYRIYRDDEVIDEASSTTYRDDDVEEDERYRYHVTAVNGAGLEGGKAGPVHVETPEEDDADDTPPGAPSDLEGKATGPNEVKLKWKEATDPESGIAHYRIYRDHEVIDEVSSTKYEDEDVEPDERYKYHVTAVNGAGLESGKAGPVHVETPEEDDAGDGDG